MTFVFGMALKQFFFGLHWVEALKHFVVLASKFSFQEYFKISKTYLPPNNHERSMTSHSYNEYKFFFSSHYDHEKARHKEN